MSRIGAKNTAPELVVRRLLHRLGYRFSPTTDDATPEEVVVSSSPDETRSVL